MAFFNMLRAMGVLPLSRENWSLLLKYWKYFTFVTPIQLLTDWYPMGRTSYLSMFNLPGKPAWMFMELVSPLTLLLHIYTNPYGAPLPAVNKWLAALYVLHYFHRAILSPLRNPSMAPVHIVMPIAGVAFNVANGSAIGAWLGGYGSAERVPMWQVVLGSAMFLGGFAGNMWHEEVLRDIRRKKPTEESVVEKDGRVYNIPHGGLFEYLWFPHYFSEWVEWTGFMIAGGGYTHFLPAALFVVNEIATMLPRALQGKRWYEQKFGAKAPRRFAAIPGLL